MPSTVRYPRGNPLTESMPFTDRNGTRWLVYIEGIPGPHGGPWHRATIPGRQLRFDSPAESRVTTELPAGSPFLADVRLQALLDLAHPVPLTPASTWPPLEAPARAHWATEWVALAREQSDAVLADWSRRWRESAGRRQAMGEQAERLLSEALDTALTVVGRIASRRRLKPR